MIETWQINVEVWPSKFSSVPFVIENVFSSQGSSQCLCDSLDSRALLARERKSNLGTPTAFKHLGGVLRERRSGQKS